MSTDSNILNLSFSNTNLWLRALTHKSFFVENRDVCDGDNEKLEFLGDAVLDLAISELLLHRFPNDAEGDLSQKRASLVNESILANVANDLNLGPSIRLGKGEKAASGASKPRILASTFEAIVGALFLDGGYPKAFEFVSKNFSDRISSLVGVVSNQDDFKTRYQEFIQKNFKTTPIYELISESGPDHDKVFLVAVKVDGLVKAQGKGRSKKMAEQMAAKSALEELQ